MIFRPAFLALMSRFEGDIGCDGLRSRTLRSVGCALAGLMVALLATAFAHAESSLIRSTGDEGVTVHYLDPQSGRPVHRFLSMATLAKLPQHTIHTRTPWTDGVSAFTGPRLADVISLASNAAPYQTLIVSALNDYVTTIPSADLTRHGVVLAMLVDGQRISVRKKGPLFVMYPFDSKPELRDSRYFGRAVWQVHRIDIR